MPPAGREAQYESLGWDERTKNSAEKDDDSPRPRASNLEVRLNSDASAMENTIGCCGMVSLIVKALQIRCSFHKILLYCC